MIDFFVFYQATLYKSPKAENHSGNQRLGKAIGIAAIIVTLWLCIVIQAFAVILFEKNPISTPIIVIAWIPLSIILTGLLSYVYETQGRWQYIISDGYDAFKMNKNLALFIGFIAMIGSIIISAGISLINN